MAAIRIGRPPANRFFEYGPADLRVFYLTRRLAALEIDRRQYARRFGADPLADFPAEFGAMRQEGLIDVGEEVIFPTPRGMFYADSAAALLAWRRVQA